MFYLISGYNRTCYSMLSSAISSNQWFVCNVMGDERHEQQFLATFHEAVFRTICYKLGPNNED